MPFAQITNLIASFRQPVGYGFFTLPQSNAVSVNACLGSILSCLQTGSRRTANRLTGKGVFKADAICCQLI